MLRLWLCILLALCAPAGGVLPAAATAEVCTEWCADDDAQGRCAPDCADCGCCSHGRTVAVVTPVLREVPAPTDLAPLEQEPSEPSSVDADDIQHVPIAVLA